MIQKKDGSLEPFDAGKLLRSLLTATVKRNIPLNTLKELVASVENDIRIRHKSTVPSSVLGDLVLKRLVDLDKVAYIRFASVYKDFKDLSEFNSELQRLSES